MRFYFYYPNYISYLAPNGSFDGMFEVMYSKFEGTLNLDGISSMCEEAGRISYSKMSRIEGDMFRGNTKLKKATSTLYYNRNLKYIESLNIATATSASNIIYQSPVVTIETVAMPTALDNMAKILDSDYSNSSSMIGELR